MSGILGKKVRMTQIFDEKGKVIPVTLISAQPCFVTQIKTNETDGYTAIQVGGGLMKEKHLNKPRAGHFKKADIKPVRYLKEFPVFSNREVKLGEELTLDMFAEGETVRVRGISKGRGFQGAMKRHGFSGANKTHGQSDRWRAPGSIGQSSYPSRVYKGLKMAGRMGNDQVTFFTQIIKIDKEKNFLFLKGSVPGASESVVEIRKK